MEKGLQKFIENNQDSHQRWVEFRQSQYPSVYAEPMVAEMTPFSGMDEFAQLSQKTKLDLYHAFMQFNGEALVLLELILCEGMKSVVRDAAHPTLAAAAKKLIVEEVDHTKAFLRFLKNDCPQFPQKSYVLRDNKLFKNSFLWIARNHPLALALPGAKIETYVIFYGKALLKAFQKRPNDWSKLNELHLLDEVHHIGYEFDLYAEEMASLSWVKKVTALFWTLVVVLYFQICFLIGCFRIVSYEMPNLNLRQKLAWTMRLGKWTLRHFEPYRLTRGYLKNQFEGRQVYAGRFFKFMYM